MQIIIRQLGNKNKRQLGNKNKENHQLSDIVLMPHQIVTIDIKRTDGCQ